MIINWKTTLIGCVIAALNVALTLYQTGTIDGKTLIISAGIAALGVFAKDFNKV